MNTNSSGYKKLLLALFLVGGTIGLWWYTDTPIVQKFEIEYHDITLEQIDEVQALIEKLLSENTGRFVSAESIAYLVGEKRSKESVEHLTKAVSDPDFYFVGAHEKGKVIGFILFRALNETTGYVDHLYIFDEYQGRGIGSRLLNMSMRNFRIQYPRAHMVLVTTRKLNKLALKFYRKHGFVKFREYREMDYDLVTMAKALRR